MKWVFFVLLAANLGLAAVIYMRDRLPNPDAQLVRQQLNADQIQIVAPRPMPAPAPRAVAPGPGLCLEWGSFGADRLAQGPGGSRCTCARRSCPQNRSGRIDQLLDLHSAAQIEGRHGQVRRMSCRQRGVTDYLPILEAGRWRYAISLGVYRNEDGAKKQLALLRQLGVRSAQIGEREQRVTQTAFVVRNPTEAQSAQLSSLKAEYPGSDLRAVDCPPS